MAAYIIQIARPFRARGGHDAPRARDAIYAWLGVLSCRCGTDPQNVQLERTRISKTRHSDRGEQEPSVGGSGYTEVLDVLPQRACLFPGGMGGSRIAELFFGMGDGVPIASLQLPIAACQGI